MIMRDRLDTHYKISTELALLSDKRLEALLTKTDSKFESGWGQSGVVDFNGNKVFVKRIPLTDIEMANAYSTKNLYKIPTWYNYGVGSAGFGAFRELAAHIKTTHWVREGSCTSFPLLHHHRVLATKHTGNDDLPDLKKYVAYWNGSRTIERYMLDRRKCKHQLVLFVEALTPLADWVAKHPLRLCTMLPRAIKCIDFVRSKGMIHFDAHEENWLTDGKNVYLTDFGLVLDEDFELSKLEQQFFSQHRYYDYAQVVNAFGNELVDIYFSMHAKPLAILENELQQSSKNTDPHMTEVIRKTIFLHESKQFKLPASMVKFIVKNQSVIFAKNRFFQTLLAGRKASDKYPARKLRRLLRESGVV